MLWSKPDFVEIILAMEVTAYANTDDKVVVCHSWSVAREEEAPASSATDNG